VILNERHLRRVMTEYVTYFNHARPHQGINQQCPVRLQTVVNVQSKGYG
jgi:hypothetical protein